jgi:hypothetical protein
MDWDYATPMPWIPTVKEDSLLLMQSTDLILPSKHIFPSSYKNHANKTVKKKRISARIKILCSQRTPPTAPSLSFPSPTERQFKQGSSLPKLTR